MQAKSIGLAASLERTIEVAPGTKIMIVAAPVATVERDELVAVAECGLPQKAVRAAIRAGKLPATKLGRALFVRRSDLLKLVELAPVKIKAPSPPTETPAARYLELVTGSRRRASR